MSESSSTATAARDAERQRWLTRRRIAAVFGLTIAVLIATEVFHQRREARAIESLERQWFQVTRSSVDEGIKGWFRDNVLTPLKLEELLAGPVTRVWDYPNSEPARPDDLSPLLTFPHLTIFGLKHDDHPGRADRINDQLLAPLASLNELTTVDIKGESSVTDLFLAGLSDCYELESLGVSSSGVTDAGLRHLAGCRKLDSLYLAGCRIRRGLASLSLEHLTELYVNDTEIDDEGVECLANARNLEELQLSRTGVGDAALNVLETLPNLRVVWMHDTGVTNAGLKDFHPVSTELLLVLPNTQATLDEAIRVTTKRPNLTVSVGDRDDFYMVQAGKAKRAGSKAPRDQDDSVPQPVNATE